MAKNKDYSRFAVGMNRAGNLVSAVKHGGGQEAVNRAASVGGSDKSLFSRAGNAWLDFNTGKTSEKLVSTIPHQTAADKRSAAAAITEQINAYKDQTKLLNDSIDEARKASEAEKRRINEKTIRSLRRGYRPASSGILGVGQPAAEDVTSKLGG